MERHRILVVDDDLMIRTLLSDSLSLDFDVDTADGADSCLAILAHQVFDAMVLDLMMPKVTGLELFHKVKEIAPDMPVIILTAYASKESAIEALRLGAHDYLEKPIEREKLIHSIRRGIERKSLKDENSHLVSELRLRVERLKLISQMGAALASSLDIERVLSLGLQMSKRAVGAESCALFKVTPQGQTEFCIALLKDGTEIRHYQRNCADVDVTNDKIASWVAKQGQPVMLSNLNDDPRFCNRTTEVTPRVQTALPSSVIAVPLSLKDKVIGVLEVINKSDGGQFSKPDMFFIRLTANFITVAIENANLTDDLKRSRAEIQAHNKLLEQKVRERTLDLTEANRELEKTNHTLIETQKKLVHSEKLASIGQLAAGVAHEINNPLGFIQSNLTTLSDYIRGVLSLVGKYENLEQIASSIDEPKLNAYIKTIAALRETLDFGYIKDDFFSLLEETKEGSNRVARIVQGLKRFSHVDQDKVELIDLNRTIEETLAIARNEVKYKAEVQLELGSVPKINGNAGLLSQVFMNILINAAQAIDKWGQIKIQTTRQNGHVIASFSDTGCGIPKENIEKIFDPFFTTKDVGVGTGLGLSISYGIIQKHGGEIDVDSEVGKGTNFTVKLPVPVEANNRESVASAA